MNCLFYFFLTFKCLQTVESYHHSTQPVFCIMCILRAFSDEPVWLFLSSSYLLYYFLLINYSVRYTSFVLFWCFYTVLIIIPPSVCCSCLYPLNGFSRLSTSFVLYYLLFRVFFSISSYSSLFHVPSILFVLATISVLSASADRYLCLFFVALSYL